MDKDSKVLQTLKNALGTADCEPWSKQEIDLFLNYCAMDEKELMDVIKVQWPQATKREMLLLILRHYEVDDKRIIALLGMSKGAWSTFLTRMRQKDSKKQDNGQ